MIFYRVQSLYCKSPSLKINMQKHGEQGAIALPVLKTTDSHHKRCPVSLHPVYTYKGRVSDRLSSNCVSTVRAHSTTHTTIARDWAHRKSVRDRQPLAEEAAGRLPPTNHRPPYPPAAEELPPFRFLGIATPGADGIQHMVHLVHMQLLHNEEHCLLKVLAHQLVN